MKFGLLVPEVLTVGGVQNYMKRLVAVLKTLSKEGHDVFCISANDESRMTAGTGPVALYGAGRSRFRFLLLAMKHARRSDYLMVGHVGQAPVASLLKSLRLIDAYGVVLHGIEAWLRLPPAKRRALEKADDVIATTKFTAETCAQLNQLDGSNITIIPLCVGSRESEPTEFKLNGDFKVLCVGRQDKTEEGKGYQTLIASARRIVDGGHPIHLNMVGDGDDQRRLIQLTDELGLTDRVTFWGRLSDEDLQAAYRDCDVFAMPSKKEGFGIVFLEAMRWGKPCIGGNHGGTPEVIVEGKSGFLVDFGDVETLAKRLIELAENRQLCADLGQHGAELIDSQYSFETFSNRFGDLFLKRYRSLANA